MAIPPSIPTSFVPKNAAPVRYTTDLSTAFNFFAYAIFAFIFLMALGVFGYSYTLSKQVKAKDQELASISIDRKTASEFIRLRDRLDSSSRLLAAHPAFSTFFATLEKITPATVRFQSFHLAFDTTGVAHIDGSGTAKSFNALAVASNALAKDGRIKDVIFSGLKVNRDSTVSFTLAASLDSSIIAFNP